MPMDQTEALVLAHLMSRGMSDVVYEPNGNVPPDFVWQGIAIEARRLNQHDEAGRGLEESTVPLVMKIRRLLKSLGPPEDSSWFVTYRYDRPLESWTALRPKIEAALRSFVGGNSAPQSIEVTENFALRLGRAGTLFESRFVLGGFTDHNAGGWVVAEMIKNLRIVIPEKTAKVTRFRPKYKTWWLALVDHIGYAGLDSADVQALRDHVTRPEEWDKILLLNPLLPERAIEL
jgi:hypothetical protein